MMFLYAYMTPGDISDYSGEFYLKNVRLALQNRKETSWGAGILHVRCRAGSKPLVP